MFQHVRGLEQLPNKDELLLNLKTEGKHCIFGLKLIDSKCETKNGATGKSIKGSAHHMKKILSSGNFADMALIVGQNKTRIPLHKNIMVQSPWIEGYLKLIQFLKNEQLSPLDITSRCFNRQATTTTDKISEIDIGECDREEVSLILDLLYTGTFKRPGPTDGESWFKLWKAAKKFEMEDLADECWEYIPNRLIKEMAESFPSQSPPLEQVPKKIKQCAVCFKELMEHIHCLWSLVATLTLVPIALKKSAIKRISKNAQFAKVTFQMFAGSIFRLHFPGDGLFQCVNEK